MKYLLSKQYRWVWQISLLLLATCLFTSISSYLVNKRIVQETIHESTLTITSGQDYSELQNKLLKPSANQLVVNIILSIIITAAVTFPCIKAAQSYHIKLQHHDAELLQKNQDRKTQSHNFERVAKDLEAANKEKDEFISIVAHDLKNPLNSIIGFSELAQMEDSGIELQAFARDVNTCGERMLELTQKLLEVSKIESFNGELVTDKVAWNHRIETSASSFFHQSAQKNINLQLDLSATDGVNIESNPDWLDVCLNNVIGNAVKYTPHYGKIDVRTRHKETHIEIEVKDNGPGISESDQKKMFQKFVRLSAQPTGNESSTGLGLYIVRKMCERLGMKIQVESGLGHGTRIVLIQPLNALPA